MVKLSSPFEDKEVRYIFFTTFILLLGACFIFWFLQFEFLNNSAAQTWVFISMFQAQTAFSVFIIFLILVFLTALARGPYRGIGIGWAIAILWSFINSRKMEARGTPFLPEDLTFTSEAGALASFVSAESIIRLILAIVIALVLGFQLEKLLGQKKLPFAWTKIEIVPRLLLAVVAVSALVGITIPIRVHGETNEAHVDEVPFVGGWFPRFSPLFCFYWNGTVLGFIYHMSDWSTEIPANYNEETLTDLANQYTSNNVDEPSLKDSDYNLIVILDESFADPTLYKDIYKYDGEATPTWRKILADTTIPSGYMYSPDYGGGTANIEYEVLTGLSNYFSGAYPYTNLLPKVDYLPSLASYARDAGYETAAIHTYISTMYQRNQVLPKLGIDKMIWEDDFAEDEIEREVDSEYINDKSLFNKVLKQIEGSDSRQFLEVITMQNHVPYESSISIFKLQGDNFDDFERMDVETYLSRLYYSDIYLGEFLKSLDELEERTVVLFFGDHAPGVYGRAQSSDDTKINTAIQLTPYFIYDTQRKKIYENQTSELNGVKLSTSLPTVSPNCLPVQLYDYLTIEKPAILKITSELCAEHPILARRYGYITADEIINRYELLNYDLLYGGRYFLKNL